MNLNNIRNVSSTGAHENCVYTSSDEEYERQPLNREETNKDKNKDFEKNEEINTRNCYKDKVSETDSDEASRNRTKSEIFLRTYSIA